MPENNTSVENKSGAELDKKPETTTEGKPGENGDGAPTDPLKKELEKVKKPRTRKEKILYKKSLLEKELAELGDDGDEVDPEEDPNKPVTVADLDRRDAEKVRKDALALTDDIEDETERELVRHHIENTIKPSGDPQQDFKNARAIVNSVKNGQIAEEAARRTTPPRTGTGSGAPAKPDDKVFEPTPEEATFMRPPYNLTKEDIIKARQKEAQKQA